MTHFTKRNITTHTSVLDNRNGLEWAVNVPVLQGKLFSRDDAMKAVETLNAEKYIGYNDWRLPTPHELFGLVGYEYGDKLYDHDAFPDMRTDDWYWTGQKNPQNPLFGFAVSFGGGVYHCQRNSKCFVRPVRGPRQ